MLTNLFRIFRIVFFLTAQCSAINNLFSFGVILTTIDGAVFEDPKIKKILNQWLTFLFYNMYHRQYLKHILVFNIQAASFTIESNCLTVYLEIHMAVNNLIRVVKVDEKFPLPTDLSEQNLQALRFKVVKILRLKIMKEFNILEKYIKKSEPKELQPLPKSVILVQGDAQQNMPNASLHNENLQVGLGNEEQKINADTKEKGIQNNTPRIWPSGIETNNFRPAQALQNDRNYSNRLNVISNDAYYPQNA